jgi:hypothetical protein
MSKKSTGIIFMVAALMFSFSVCASAFEAQGLEALLPQTDIDFMVLQNNQSKTVTADLSFPLDFGVIPVTLIGYGKFSVTLTRPGTSGEIVYMYLSVVKGFGNPSYDLKTGLTPFRSLSSFITISEDEDFNWAQVMIVHGILFSPEDPPYEYNLKLSF